MLLALSAAPAHAQQPDVEASLHGLVLVNAFHTTDPVNNSDVPQFAVPATVQRWSHLSPAPDPARRRGARLAAAHPAGGTGVTARGGGEPVVALQHRFPEFAGAGNLWVWIAQLRLSADLAGAGGARFGVEAAVLAPTAGEPQDGFTTQPDRAERSGRPYLQGRARARWGTGDAQGEIGVAGHYGWLVDGTGERIASRALVASLETPLGGGFELRAEGFTGQALAGLGGGGIGQSMVRDGVPVRTSGGWVHTPRRWEPSARPM